MCAHAIELDTRFSAVSEAGPTAGGTAVFVLLIGTFSESATSTQRFLLRHTTKLGAGFVL